MENLMSVFTNELIHSFTTEIDNDINTIDNITDEFVNLLKECAQCCYHKR